MKNLFFLVILLCTTMLFGCATIHRLATWETVESPLPWMADINQVATITGRHISGHRISQPAVYVRLGDPLARIEYGCGTAEAWRTDAKDYKYFVALMCDGILSGFSANLAEFPELQSKTNGRELVLLREWMNGCGTTPARRECGI